MILKHFQQGHVFDFLSSLEYLFDVRYIQIEQG